MGWRTFFCLPHLPVFQRAGEGQRLPPRPRANGAGRSLSQACAVSPVYRRCPHWTWAWDAQEQGRKLLSQLWGIFPSCVNSRLVFLPLNISMSLPVLQPPHPSYFFQYLVISHSSFINWFFYIMLINPFPANPQLLLVAYIYGPHVPQKSAFMPLGTGAKCLK